MADDWGFDSAPTGGAVGGGQDRSSRPKGCFNCGQDGHNKSECPNPSNRPARPCFNCGEEGHMKTECPNPSNRPARPCFNCGEEGHMKTECPNPAQERKSNGRGLTDEDGKHKRGCFKCGEEGHSKNECPLPDLCRLCGEAGHTSMDCTSTPVTRTVQNAEGVDKEVYIPKEIEDTQLFDQGIGGGVNLNSLFQAQATISGDVIPGAIDSFAAGGFRPLLMENIRKSGYTNPTPIQRAAFGAFAANRDLMGCAQTGSGKTAAFLIPIVNALFEAGCGASSGLPQKPEALVITPTRELAIQIKDEARKFSFQSSLRSVVIYGGTSSEFQTRDAYRGVNILVATPGRLKDFVNRGKISFEELKFLVLDEADRLLDMGFSDDLKEIINHSTMPAKDQRRTLMFSATFPEDVQTLATAFLSNHLFARVGVVGAASTDVKQTILELPKREKREKLLEILLQYPASKCLVFTETKKTCDFIAMYICTEGLQATSIHGDRLQREREIALNEFKRGTRNILLATNVAARGLDIKNVDVVVNFDLPSSIDEYVHRIGRTGRVGNIGTAISFFDPNDDRDVLLGPELLRILVQGGQEVPAFLQAYGGVAAGGQESVDIRQNVVEEEW